MFSNHCQDLYKTNYRELAETMFFKLTHEQTPSICNRNTRPAALATYLDEGNTN